MNKKFGTVIAAFITAFSLCFTAARANYYSVSEYPSVSPDALVCSGFNISALQSLAAEGEAVLQGNGKDREERLTDILNSCCDEVNNAYSEYILALIACDIDYSAAAAEKKDSLYKSFCDAQKIIYSLITKIYDAGLKSVLDDAIGEEYTDEIISNIPDDVDYALLQKEQQLINSYSEMYGESEKCAELFVSLVSLRNEEAKKYGFDNYADYSYYLYGRGFTREQVRRLSDEVARDFAPYLVNLLEARRYSGDFSLKTDEKSLLDSVGAVLGNINAELKGSFDYMRENGLYDVSYSEKKSYSGSAYTSSLPREKGGAFMYVSPGSEYDDDACETFKTIIHETGHFSALLNDPSSVDRWADFKSSISVDISEIHSLSLEMLAMKNYGKIFGAGAQGARLDSIIRLWYGIIDGCMFNEWQEAVYACDNLTVDFCNKKASELYLKYYGMPIGESDAMDMWTKLPHNFHSPMYYISYAVAGAAALEILCMSEEDYERAADVYMRISASGCRGDFLETLSGAGLRNIFESGAAADIAAAVTDRFLPVYADIDYSAWYTEYLYKTAYLLSGASDGLFGPNENITRYDFIVLIGKMYEDCKGINETPETTFKDVDKNGDGAKYISWAQDKGIINGLSNDIFGGEYPITREETAAVFYRLVSLDSDAPMTESEVLTFNDSAEISPWAEQPVKWMYRCKMLSGRGNNMLCPKEYTTNAEAAKLVCAYMEMTYVQ